MGAVYFYHLTQRPLEATLPVLLDRARGQNWRVVVRGTDAERMAWLDEKLWLNPEDGFLPHGLAGGPHDALQAILLTVNTPDTADCLMCVDGAGPTADEVAKAQRACVLFDGNDPAAVETARGQWKTLTDAGCVAQYWSEASGRWEMRAQSDGASG